MMHCGLFVKLALIILFVSNTYPVDNSIHFTIFSDIIKMEIIYSAQIFTSASEVKSVLCDPILHKVMEFYGIHAYIYTKN